MLLLLALAGPVALAQQAPPGDLAEEADLHFERAADAYRRRDYDEALEHLLLSNRLAPNRNVVFNIARTYEQLGQFDSAFRYYNDYVRMEDDPELQAEGREAMSRIAARVALVTIEAAPVGATVYIDREDLGARGVTPLTLALPPGEHTVFVKQEGYHPTQARTSLAVGGTAEVSVVLVPIRGQVELSGEPAGARVFLGDTDGTPVGELPGTLTLAPGPQLLVIEKDGYRTARELVEVEADGLVQRAIALEELSGTLVVDAAERGALIEVDGVPEGFTPAVLDLPVGAHQVRISKPGFRTFEQDIEINTDERSALSVRLRSQQELSAASRDLRRAEDAPASVSIITGAELRAFGYQEVYDAVAGTRGLYTTNDLTYQYLGFRGFGRPGDYGNRVLVTVDGHTLNDDQIGASYVGSDLMVDLHDVEQIEIVRGPGSALYGSNAFFGVINVVTRERDSALGPHAVVTADGGRTLRTRAGASVGDAQRGASVSAAGMVSQGRDYAFEAYEEGDGEGVVNDADRTRAWTLHGKAWLGDWTAQAFYTGRMKQVPTGAFETILGDPRATSDDHRSFAELRYTPSLGPRANLSARAYVDRYRFVGDFPYEDEGLYRDRWQGTWAGVEPRVRLSPVERLDITAGVEARFNFLAELDSYSPDGPLLEEEPRQAVISAYGVVEAQAARWLRASAEARYDYFTLEDIGGTFNPRLAAILQPGEDDVLKVLGGTAFRAPSPYELFYNDGGLTQVRPAKLEPERVRTAELEYTRRFTEVISGTAAAYFNQILSLVDTEVVAEEDDEVVLRFTNVEDRVHTGGVELELRRDWRQGAMIAAQGSLQRTRVGDWLGGEYLTNSPWALAALKAAAPAPLPGTTVATRVQVGSPRLTTQDTWTGWAVIWDVTLTGALPEQPVEYGFGVRNLLDWDVTHPGGYDLLQAELPQPGRSLFATVKVGF
ncbi:MAG: TonB-dependent receptor [Alphaproteobacteria bacterium]|nr:TonB-dependent receptor [Alphaproteobacteria bacterium]